VRVRAFAVLVTGFAATLAATPSASSERGVSAGTGTVTATCDHAVRGEPPPVRCNRATIAWDFALYGVGRDFSTAHRTPRGEFIAKIPAIVKRSEPYMLSVPNRKIGKFGLNYGPVNGQRLDRAASAVTFEPCADRRRTGWAGVLVLKTRKPVELKVENASGDLARIRVGRLRGERRGR
jgi:hypothetical protein